MAHHALPSGHLGARAYNPHSTASHTIRSAMTSRPHYVLQTLGVRHHRATQLSCSSAFNTFGGLSTFGGIFRLYYTGNGTTESTMNPSNRDSLNSPFANTFAGAQAAFGNACGYFSYYVHSRVSRGKWERVKYRSGKKDLSRFNVADADVSTVYDASSAC